MNKTFGADKFKRLLPFFILALAIIVTYRVTGEMEFFAGFFRRVWGILAPFFYGFILAYIINIPISGIQRLLAKIRIRFIFKRQRMFSVIIVLVILAALITLTVNMVAPAIAGSVQFFAENWEIYWAGILQFVDDFNALGLFGWHIDAEFVFGILGDVFAYFSFEDFLQPFNVLMDVGAAVFTVVIAFISSIYILVEKDKFKKYLRNLLRVFTSEEVGGTIIWTFGRLNENFRQYIRTQTIDGLILGTMATIALVIMGSPFALVLGIMLGILNYIPYFGSIFGTIIAVVVVMLTEGFTMGAIAAGSLLVIQQIDANIVQPRLMSGSFSLSPLLVIISITVGGALAGIFGMIVAIPIIAVLKEIFDSIVAYYDRKKFGETKEGEQI